jgi:alpha-beta hydrolase superfamily lysophospholipase
MTPWRDETFTASDGYRWNYRRYLPPEEPRAELVCLHGIQSHAGWYEHSCRVLAQAGFAVSFLDRRGSGTNQQARGDAPGFRRLLDDVAEYLRSLRKPVLLLAISWGGKLAVALQKRHPGLVKALALLCPGFCSKVRPSFAERMAILWARMTRPSRLFPIPLDDAELFTMTPRWLEFLRHDPLALRRATARLLIESVRLDYYIRWAVKWVTVPVFMQLAEHDRIIDNARTRKFVQRFPGETRIIEYAGAHHTLEFEEDPELFLVDLRTWLLQQCEEKAEA